MKETKGSDNGLRLFQAKCRLVRRVWMDFFVGV